MRSNIQIILFFTALACAFSVSAQERVLEWVAEPVATEAAVWEITSSERAKEIARYDVYADSLLSEIVGGERLWYELRGDSLLLIKHETRLSAVTPPQPIESRGFARTGVPTQHPLSLRGHHSHTFDMTVAGSVAYDAPRRGRIVAAPGDTVAAVMTTEHWLATADSTMRYETDRYRWFTGTDQLPVAVQTEKNILTPDGRLASTSTETYVADLSYWPESGGADEAAVLQALEAATATFDNGHLTITCPMPLSLDLYVTDQAGLLYHHAAFATDGSTPAVVELPSLAPARYIAVLACGTLQAKHLFSTF